MTLQTELQVVLVSGLSGAGKSSVLNVFEDLGFFCIDGLPLQALPSIISLFYQENIFRYKGLALGLNPLERNFLQDWEEIHRELQEQKVRVQLIFIEAATDVLLRRYATTRRPHPLEKREGGLENAIYFEQKHLESVREKADLVIDSSQYSIHDLRRIVQEKWDFLSKSGLGMHLYFVTFGFKYGIPKEADLMFDLRFLPNPYFDESLRPLCGKDKVVADYVLLSETGREFYTRFLDFLNYTVPLFAKEGRYRLTIAIGCTGGRHRSVAFAEALFQHFQDVGYAASLEHRHLALG